MHHIQGQFKTNDAEANLNYDRLTLHPEHEMTNEGHQRCY